MVEHFDPLAALIVVVMLGLGGALVEARAFKARQREADLREAISLLDIHYQSLVELDDEDTPISVLELALDWNRIIHDPSSPSIIAEHAEVLSNSGRRNGRRPRTETSEAIVLLTQRRPDLAEAFVRATLSGIEAFLLRYPKCRPALGHLLLDLAAAPAEETMRVVRLASQAKGSGTLAAA
nr:hypothetical protein [Bradyrhizobium sp. CCH5-A9]